MTISRVTMGCAALVALLNAPSLNAQIFTPTYLAPALSSDIGIYLADGPGDLAVEGIWRRTFGQYDLGLRGGVANTPDLAVLIGVDYRRGIALGSPLALAMTGGAQAALGGADGIGAAVGLSIGYLVRGSGIDFLPYFHPQIAVIDGLNGRETALKLLADIGFDLGVTSNLDLRFGATLERNGSDFGVGLAWH